MSHQSTRRCQLPNLSGQTKVFFTQVKATFKFGKIVGYTKALVEVNEKDDKDESGALGYNEDDEA